MSRTPFRVLFSVTDKQAIVPFASRLDKLGWEIVGTAGTADHLNRCGVVTKTIEEIIGFGESLGHRVKTLDVRILGGLLWNKRDAQHNKDATRLGLIHFDLLVESFYAFETAVHDIGHTDDVLEYIDIGGPTMLRSAAKNYSSVIPLVEKDDYDSVLEAIVSSNGDPDGVPLAERRRLAAVAFKHLQAYDAPIQRYLEAG